MQITHQLSRCRSPPSLNHLALNHLALKHLPLNPQPQSSDVEGGAFDMRQEWPPGSGTSHPLWILDSPARLRDQAEAARAILRGPLRQLTAGSSGAASSPSYTPVPQLSRLCGRNLRAAFQRYCAKWNKASVLWRRLRVAVWVLGRATAWAGGAPARCVFRKEGWGAGQDGRFGSV